MIDAPDVVPGDIVTLEAGDLVPADGRILRSATVEVRRRHSRGECASAQGRRRAAAGMSASGIARTCFSRTRRSPEDRCDGRHGHWDEHPDGSDRHDVDIRGTHPIPLQKELDGLTKVLGIIAWVAVAFIVLVGWLRGVDLSDLLLLGTAMAISGDPHGYAGIRVGVAVHGCTPTRRGQGRREEPHGCGDPGSTSVINTDKTGTLTLNQMMVSQLYTQGRGTA